ncbi:ATP-binding protein [Spectribacter hydrogenooxidans]|uniref:DUF87 domain-containing protein n=1 Tax=Spectribacter hydrogenoxidans TaxID=3075608 RepID=A0ABU3BY96_9GAMM|nr:DUF87 domain-containing protein [Salinisphaera sp. W335]MDT0634114.1 DUF87 domain-containing protein [Salinisphaera sp. W335]
MQTFENIVERAQPLARLCGEAPETRHVGFIIRMNYDRVEVLTNDHWRERVQGIPQNAILIAASFDPARLSSEPEMSRFVLAMRVLGPAPIQHEAENVAAIIEHHRSKTTAEHAGPLDGMDAYTHAHLQFSGLSCKVLGSFFQTEQGALAYGADIEDYFSVSSMRVFKPTGDALEMIANYCDPHRLEDARRETLEMGFPQPPDAFEFGLVRYTSTNRLQRKDGTDVPVSFQTADVMAKRCGVFGMTRTGKSNLVKTLAGSIALESMRAGGRVGQLILDLNGEYANANEQDRGALSQVFEDNVVRYRTRKPEGDFFDLRPNFYQSLDIGLTTLREALQADGSLGGADIKNFMEMELESEQPNDRGEGKRWAIKFAAYRCLLDAAGYEKTPSDDRVTFELGAKAASQAYQALELGDATNEAERAKGFRDHYGDPSRGMPLSNARSFFVALRKAEIELRGNSDENIGLRSSSGKAWMDESVLTMINLMVGRNKSDTPINSTNVLARYRNQHSARGTSSPAGEIHKHLSQGRIVIVDLSLSRPSERKELMERIAQGLFQLSLDIFTDAQRPPPILIYIEEAHNLIGKKADPDEPWPRVAKEGGKTNIGLVYATQEPSSIQPNILSNTENIISSHLNNDDEIRTLGKYYDFEDFGASLKKAQDVGFVRIKRLSAPFVMPVYVHKFEPETMEQLYQRQQKPEGFEPAPKPAQEH